MVKWVVEIAKAFAEKGADVNLVLGPSDLKIDFPGINVIRVNTADEMYANCIKLFPKSDITVLSAAVADYKPSRLFSKKIKKEDGVLTIELEPTKDILATLGSNKTEQQFLAGFALETDNEELNALKKLENKNLDMIVLNSLNDQGAGFGTSTNKVSIFMKNGSRLDLPLNTKKAIAEEIVNQIVVLTKPE